MQGCCRDLLPVPGHRRRGGLRRGRVGPARRHRRAARSDHPTRKGPRSTRSARRISSCATRSPRSRPTAAPRRVRRPARRDRARPPAHRGTGAVVATPSGESDVDAVVAELALAGATVTGRLTSPTPSPTPPAPTSCPTWPPPRSRRAWSPASPPTSDGVLAAATLLGDVLLARTPAVTADDTRSVLAAFGSQGFIGGWQDLTGAGRRSLSWSPGRRRDRRVTSRSRAPSPASPPPGQTVAASTTVGRAREPDRRHPGRPRPGREGIHCGRCEHPGGRAGGRVGGAGPARRPDRPLRRGCRRRRWCPAPCDPAAAGHRGRHGGSGRACGVAPGLAGAAPGLRRHRAAQLPRADGEPRRWARRGHRGHRGVRRRCARRRPAATRRRRTGRGDHRGRRGPLRRPGRYTPRPRSQGHRRALGGAAPRPGHKRRRQGRRVGGRRAGGGRTPTDPYPGKGRAYSRGGAGRGRGRRRRPPAQPARPAPGPRAEGGRAAHRAPRRRRRPGGGGVRGGRGGRPPRRPGRTHHAGRCRRERDRRRPRRRRGCPDRSGRSGPPRGAARRRGHRRRPDQLHRGDRGHPGLRALDRLGRRA